MKYKTKVKRIIDNKNINIFTKFRNMIVDKINDYNFRDYNSNIIYEEYDKIVAIDKIHNRDFVIGFIKEFINERQSKPYFKIYNNIELKFLETGVAKLHFKDNEREYYLDGFNNLELTDTDISEIKEFLNLKYYDSDNTIWQVLCYEWNKRYFSLNNLSISEYENIKIDNDMFIPYNQSIPIKWNLS